MEASASPRRRSRAKAKASTVRTPTLEREREWTDDETQRLLLAWARVAMTRRWDDPAARPLVVDAFLRRTPEAETSSHRTALSIHTRMVFLARTCKLIEQHHRNFSGDPPPLSPDTILARHPGGNLRKKELDLMKSITQMRQSPPAGVDQREKRTAKARSGQKRPASGIDAHTSPVKRTDRRSLISEGKVAMLRATPASASATTTATNQLTMRGRLWPCEDPQDQEPAWSHQETGMLLNAWARVAEMYKGDEREFIKRVHDDLVEQVLLSDSVSIRGRSMHSTQSKMASLWNTYEFIRDRDAVVHGAGLPTLWFTLPEPTRDSFLAQKGFAPMNKRQFDRMKTIETTTERRQTSTEFGRRRIADVDASVHGSTNHEPTQTLNPISAALAGGSGRASAHGEQRVLRAIALSDPHQYRRTIGIQASPALTSASTPTLRSQATRLPEVKMEIVEELPAAATTTESSQRATPDREGQQEQDQEQERVWSDEETELLLASWSIMAEMRTIDNTLLTHHVYVDLLLRSRHPQPTTPASIHWVSFRDIETRMDSLRKAYEFIRARDTLVAQIGQSDSWFGLSSQRRSQILTENGIARITKRWFDLIKAITEMEQTQSMVLTSCGQGDTAVASARTSSTLGTNPLPSTTISTPATNTVRVLQTRVGREGRSVVATPLVDLTPHRGTVATPRSSPMPRGSTHTSSRGSQSTRSQANQSNGQRNETQPSRPQERGASSQERTPFSACTPRHAAAIWVDNSNITRTRVVPTRRFTDDPDFCITLTNAVQGRAAMRDTPFESPVGEVYLLPEATRTLHNISKWMADTGAFFGDMQRDNRGTEWMHCPRSFLRRQVDLLRTKFDLMPTIGFEMEFQILDRETQQPIDSSLYCSMKAFHDGRAWTLLKDIVECLEDDLKIPVHQYHAESASGQLEISTGTFGVDATTSDAIVHAVDKLVLARQTIYAMAAQRGFQATFLPKLKTGEAGNAAHIHIGLSDVLLGRNLFAADLEEAKRFLAGILDELPALCMLLAPTVNSYDRLQPNCWAGAYQCYGYENREAPLRLVGPTAARDDLTKLNHFEVKTLDGTANPYLALGAILAAGMLGIDHRSELPEPCTQDPASLRPSERPALLPRSLQEAIECFEARRPVAWDGVLSESYAALLVTLRRAELEHYSSLGQQEQVVELLKRY